MPPVCDEGFPAVVFPLVLTEVDAEVEGDVGSR